MTFHHFRALGAFMLTIILSTLCFNVVDLMTAYQNNEARFERAYLDNISGKNKSTLVEGYGNTPITSHEQWKLSGSMIPAFGAALLAL